MGYLASRARPIDPMQAMGHAVALESPDAAFCFGGAQLIHRLPQRGYFAGSDPRKDRCAAGF